MLWGAHSRHPPWSVLEFKPFFLIYSYRVINQHWGCRCTVCRTLCTPCIFHSQFFFQKKELKTQCRTKKGRRKLQIQIKKNSQSNFIEARTVCTVCCTVCTVRTMCRTLCVGIPTAGKKRRKSVLGGRGNVA